MARRITPQNPHETEIACARKCLSAAVGRSTASGLPTGSVKTKLQRNGCWEFFAPFPEQSTNSTFTFFRSSASSSPPNF
jgi:hypothetical protein